MAVFNNIAGAEPSTVTFRLGSVVVTRGSTSEHQEIVVLGDPDTSNAIAAILNTTPASTAWALAVREVAPTTSVRVTQSSAADLNVTVAGYVAPSTIVTVSTGSVRVHQSSAADLNVTVSGYSTIVAVSSLAGAVQARVHDSSGVALSGSTAAPATGDNGLVVRQVGYVAPSTTVAVSTGSVRVHQSSAADLNVTVAGYVAPSTIVTVSGYVAPSTIVTVSTGSVRVHQSTAADLAVTASQNSTAWSVLARVTTSSGGGVEGSTASPAAGVTGLHVRAVLPTRLSTTVLAYIETAGGSTTIISSAAGVRHRVYAFSVMSTVVAFSSCAFLSSAAIERWGLLLGSGSSGITGANLAVAPPGSLFETDVANALQFSASSTGHYRVSVSYFTE